MSEVRLVRGRWIVTGGAAGDAVLEDAALRFTWPGNPVSSLRIALSALGRWE